MLEKYLYESHMGGYYSSEKKLSYNALYCEECGDSDYLVGSFTDENSLKKLLNDLDKEYVEKIIEQEFFESMKNYDKNILINIMDKHRNLIKKLILDVINEFEEFKNNFQ